ncbi:MAG: glycoside hydrolase family 16 protein, partial [Pseudomonadota bacterium]
MNVILAAATAMGLTASAVLSAPVPVRADDGQAPLDLAGRTITFAEEFDSLSVSAWGEEDTRWI